MPAVDPLLQHIADNETESLEWLTRAATQISFESNDKPFLSDPGFLRKFVDKVGNYLTGFRFHLFDGKRIPLEPMTKLLQQNGAGYKELRGGAVEVPPGFKGNIQDFLDIGVVLLPNMLATSTDLDLIIKTLAVLINEPDRMAAQTGIRGLEAKLRLIEADDLDSIKKHFQPNTKTVAKFSDCFYNSGEFLESVKMCNGFVDKMSGVDAERIKKQTTRVAELAKALNESLSRDEDAKVSGLVAAQLSDLFRKLGVSITATSVLIETLGQMNKAMATNVESLVATLQASASNESLESMDLGEFSGEAFEWLEKLRAQAPVKMKEILDKLKALKERSKTSIKNGDVWKDLQANMKASLLAASTAHNQAGAIQAMHTQIAVANNQMS